MAKTKNKLQRFRESKGLSRKELAQILNCSISQVCNLEGGRSRLTDANRETLVDYFDELDEDYFLNFSNNFFHQTTERNTIIGNNIKFYRRRSGMTQSELAEVVGYKNNSVISMIERGMKSPSKEKMINLAEAFDIHVSELFGDKEAQTLTDSESLVNKFVYLINAKHEASSLKAIEQLINTAYIEVREKERSDKQHKYRA